MEGDESREELRLEPAAPVKGKDFAHVLKHYVVPYATAERNIKKWIAIGKTKGELPPLDDAQAMITWWAKYMQHKVPGKILNAAAAQEAGKRTMPASIPPVAAEDDRGRAATRDGDATASLNLEDRAENTEADVGSTISRLRPAEKAAGEAYAAIALAEATYTKAKLAAKTLEEKEAAENIRVSSSDVELKRRAWESLAQSLRLAEQTASRVAREAGDLLDKSVVARVVREFHDGQCVQFRKFFPRVWQMLKALPDEGERDKVWEAEVQAFLGGFQRELKFS